MKRPLRVLLDPAHGGDNFGAVSANNLFEKDAALALALEAERQFLEEGMEVNLTRRDDERVPHSVRRDMAEWADLTLSLHWHASKNRDDDSAQAWARTKDGEALAREVIKRLAEATGQKATFKYTMNRITQGSKPVVLLIAGMLTHVPTEASIVGGFRYQTVARALVHAVRQWRRP